MISVIFHSVKTTEVFAKSFPTVNVCWLEPSIATFPSEFQRGSQNILNFSDKIASSFKRLTHNRETTLGTAGKLRLEC